MTLSRCCSTLLLLCPASFAGTIYVDANLTTGLNDGSSWANAFQGARGLRDANNLAVAGDVIFVAAGRYTPANGTNRTKSIVMLDDVEMYGGFLGGESSPAERPPFGTAPSIIDGDLLENDSSGMFGDNSYHCVRAGTAGPSAVLDGFVIRGGNSNGTGNNNKGAGILCLDGAPTIRSCHFVDHRCTFGGAAGYINGSGPAFIDCIFEGGDGGSFGGAFDIATGTPGILFDRCVFKDNTADRAGALEVFSTSGVTVSNSVFYDNVSTGSGGGGGMWVGSGGTTLVVNCTFVGNSATTQNVGGLRNQGATVTVANSVFWDNEGPGGAQDSANQIGGSPTVSYSIVEGGFSGTGNLNSDPLFVDLAGRDLRLTSASPAVDAADNGMVSPLPLDAGRAPRYVDEPLVADTGVGSAPIVDMGAYESSVGFADLYCEALPNSTGAASVLAATGSSTLADNDVNLVVSGLPAGEFGYFLMSDTTVQLPVASGVLCLGAPQLRFSGDVLNSGSGGVMLFTPDLTNLPQGQVLNPGETWFFQVWHRNGATSNFSTSLGVTWE